jgi:hypothetical protein
LGIEEFLKCIGFASHADMKMNPRVVFRLVDKRDDDKRLRLDSANGVQPYLAVYVAVVKSDIEGIIKHLGCFGRS